MLFLSVILPPTSGIRLKHPQKSKKTTCSFCGERHKQNDGTPLSPLSHQLTKWYFLFPIYCCDECVGDGKLTYLVEIINVIGRLENLHVSITFNDHSIVNPSDVYIPVVSSLSGNLEFLCISNKCSMKIFCDTSSRETDLFHKSTIHGCVINPSSGEIKTESISIAKIILGVDLLNRILKEEFQCSYIQPICDFHAVCPDVSPRIRNFSITDPNSILKLFSLVVSEIYSDGAIYAVLNGEMKEPFLKFITDSMISMTAFMRQNGFNDKFPELKEESAIPDFLVKNYGKTSFSFNYQDIICQNFRNFLKLFRKILRYLSYVDDSQRSIDLFQYCSFLYATLHVGNKEIYHRFVRLVSIKTLSQYFEYLERYHMSASPFCVEIFAMVPASETELDKCVICQSDNSASVIGKCPQHNICCLSCFSRVVKLSSCPTCRGKFFLP
jgi:hypothetical protein